MAPSPILLKYSTFRTVDWRWQQAQWLVREGKRSARTKDDAATLRAVEFLQLAARGGRTVACHQREFPDLNSARQLHERGGSLELEVQARILSQQSRDEITRRTGVTAEVIDAYVVSFFDVEHHLTAMDWIVTQAIWRGHNAAGVSQIHASLLKQFAYYGGPLILDDVMPFLIGGKDLWADPPDLSTAEGRADQRTRLLVALELLPQDAKTNWKLGLLSIDRLHRRGKTPTATTTAEFLKHNLDQKFKDLAVTGKLAAATRKQMSLGA